MPDYAKNIADLQRQIQEAIDRLAQELKRIDDKISPVIEGAEERHPQDGLFKANLELKQSYIEQGKQAIMIQALVSIQHLLSAQLELEVKKAQAEADAAAAEAAAEKAQHKSEKDAKVIEADAQAKADAEKAKADSDKAAADAAKAKADADLAAAKAKADAERDAAQKDFDSEQKSIAAKKQAALKKAEQDAIKATIEALDKATAAFKATAETTKLVKAMKDDIEKEIKEKEKPIVDGPAPTA